MWDPQQYLVFADQRGRPFAELTARITATAPRTVVDLGCGPGNLTLTLAERWPTAEVTGVDSSAQMLAAAPHHDRVRFVEADLRDWHPDSPVDVLVSNATLQWVPGHLDLLPELVAHVAPDGWFGFQVPGNFAEAAHVILRELTASPRWQPLLGNVVRPAVHEPGGYLDALLSCGLEADVWETTYFQVLPGPDAVLEWMTGTALRPMLTALAERGTDDGDREEFMAEYAERLRVAYPAGPHGTTLPYRRIFAVGRKRS